MAFFRSPDSPASEADQMLTPSCGYRQADAGPAAFSDGASTVILTFDQAMYDAIRSDDGVQLLNALHRPDEPPFLQTFADGPDQMFTSQVTRGRDGQDHMVQKFSVDGIPKSAGQRRRMSASVSLCDWHTLAAVAARPYAVQNASARVGVFFCVNALEPRASRRNSDAVRRVVALFLDMDGAPLPPEGFRLRPTSIVESSRGRYHVYWAVSDLPLHEFTPAQKHLAGLYGGDPSVSDLARVMRLPGYWHGKSENAFLSRLVEVNPDAQYTRADMLGVNGFPGLQEALTAAEQVTAERLQRVAERQMRVDALRAELDSGTVTDRAEACRKYGQAALLDETGRLIRAGQGSRNNQLYRSGAALGGCVAAGILEQAEVEIELRTAALACGLGEHETEATLKRGTGKGMQQARDLSKVGQRMAKKDRQPRTERQPSAPQQGGSAGPLPEIDVSGRQLRDIAADAVSALKAANEPPVLFRWAGKLGRLVPESMEIRTLDAVALKGELARCADFVRTVASKGGPEVSAARPPADLAPDLLARVDRLPFPPLHLLTNTPVYSARGELVLTEGYHPGSGIYLNLQGLKLPDLTDPADALSLLQEMLCDFPFTHVSGFAHTLSAMLLPFLRPMIDGPTPLMLINAATRGTGKGLLSTVIPLVALGEAPGVMAQSRNSDEFEKRVTAMLRKGSRVILLDNVHALQGEALAAVLTARTWRGRLLGQSEMLTLPNDALWLATGNNVKLDDDMPRRIVPIRIDAGVERPEDRTGFRHPDLLSWIAANRPALVAACLSLIEAWKAAGRPTGKKRLGSYERWSAVLGGVLDVAGVPGFLEGRETLYDMGNPEPAEWGHVLEAVYTAHGSKPQPAKTFFLAMHGLEMLADLWEGHKPLGQLQRVGRALLAHHDRVYNGRRIRAAGIDSTSKNRLYSVEPVTDGGVMPALETPQTPVKHCGKTAVQKGIPGVSGVSGVLFEPTD